MSSLVVRVAIQPMSGLFLCGRVLEESVPTDIGFRLADVKWDLDRKVFLATTSLVEQDLPLAFIPDTLRAYVSQGWRFGSYSDHYGDSSESEDLTSNEDMVPDNQTETEYKRMEALQTRAQNMRPNEFNRLFKAIIAEMVRSWNNLPTAYAMDSLHRLIEMPDDRHQTIPAEHTPLQKRWAAARRECECLGFDKQWEWRENVLNSYPSIEEII